MNEPINVNVFRRLKAYVSDEAIKKIITYSFFGLLPILSGFLLTPFYTRSLSQEEYGQLSYYNVLQSYATLALILGLDTSLSRYYFEFKRNQKVLKELFASAFQFMVFFSVLACSVIYLAQPLFTSAHSIKVYMAIIANTLFTVIISAFINYYRDEQNLRKFILYSVLLFVIMSVSALGGILFISKDADGCIYGRLFGVLLLTLIVVTVHPGFFFQRFSLKLLGKLMLFALPLIPYTAIGTIYDSLDRFMIEKEFSLTDLAVYNISFVMAFLINVLVNSLMQTYNPKIFHSLNESREEKERSLPLLADLRKNMFIIICSCVVLLSLVSYPLVYIFAGSSYLGSVKYVPLIGFSFVLRLYFTVYSTPLFYYKKSLLLSLIVATSVIVFLIVFFSLRHSAGLFTVPIALICSRLAQVGITFVLIKKAKYDLDFGSGIKHYFSIISGIACVLLTIIYYYYA